MNPNDTVTITNSKTKAVKRVKRSELPNYGLPVDYQSQADVYAEAVKSGQLTIDKIPESHRGGAQMALNESGYAKKKALKEDPSNIIDQLEGLYFTGGQTTGLAKSVAGVPGGRVPGYAAEQWAKLSPNEQAEVYKRVLESARPALAKAAGDSGNLALQEQLAAGRGLPQGFTETPEEAFSLFRAARQKFGMQPSDRLTKIEQNYQGQKTNTPQDDPGKTILDFLFGNAINATKDIGVGAAYAQAPETLQAQQDSIEMAKRAGDRAQTVKDPEQRRRLMAVANNTLSQTSNTAQEQSQSYSSSVMDNPIIRSLLAGAEVGGGAAVAAHPVQAVKAPLDFLTKGVKAAQQGTKILTKKGAAELSSKAAKEASAQGAGVPWDDVAKKITDEAIETFGDTKEVRDSVQKLLASRTPPGIESMPETLLQTPDDLLRWRRQISARQGKGFLERALKGNDLDDKVENIARRTVSNEVHRLAPGTRTPDKAYSLYSKGGKFGGDVPTWLLRIAAIEAARRSPLKDVPILGTILNAGSKIVG